MRFAGKPLSWVFIIRRPLMSHQGQLGVFGHPCELGSQYRGTQLSSLHRFFNLVPLAIPLRLTTTDAHTMHNGCQRTGARGRGPRAVVVQGVQAGQGSISGTRDPASQSNQARGVVRLAPVHTIVRTDTGKHLLLSFTNTPCLQSRAPPPGSPSPWTCRVLWRTH